MIPFRPNPHWYSALWRDADMPGVSAPVAPSQRKPPAVISPRSDLGLAALILVLGLALAAVTAVSIPLGSQTIGDIAIID